jgi:hypothetical protein
LTIILKRFILRSRWTGVAVKYACFTAEFDFSAWLLLGTFQVNASLAVRQCDLPLFCCAALVGGAVVPGHGLFCGV